MGDYLFYIKEEETMILYENCTLEQALMKFVKYNKLSSCESISKKIGGHYINIEFLEKLEKLYKLKSPFSASDFGGFCDKMYELRWDFLESETEEDNKPLSDEAFNDLLDNLIRVATLQFKN